MATAFEIPIVLKDAQAAFDDEKALKETRAYQHVVAYFVGDAAHRPYAGASFEILGHSWRDDATVNTITVADLLALGTLSTPLKKYTAAELLDDGFQARASSLLSQVPPDAQIDDDRAADWLADASPAAELYNLVRGVSGMGKTRTSKLLARKRPGLVPIRDWNVEEALGAHTSADWWLPFRAMATSGVPSAVEVARKLHHLAGLSPVVMPLRVLDAILWRSVESPDGQGSDEPDADE